MSTHTAQVKRDFGSFDISVETSAGNPLFTPVVTAGQLLDYLVQQVTAVADNMVASDHVNAPGTRDDTQRTIEGCTYSFSVHYTSSGTDSATADNRRSMDYLNIQLCSVSTQASSWLTSRYAEFRMWQAVIADLLKAFGEQAEDIMRMITTPQSTPQSGSNTAKWFQTWLDLFVQYLLTQSPTNGLFDKFDLRSLSARLLADLRTD